MAAPCEALPVEVWMMILDYLDDNCFTWFIIRRVSPFLRQVAESLLAIQVLRNTTITFTGDYVKSTSLVDISVKDRDFWEWEQTRVSTRDRESRHLTFAFRPSHFAPTDTKTRLVLKLHESPDNYGFKFPRERINVQGQSCLATHTSTFSLRRQCCFCRHRIQDPVDVTHCNCLAKIFFAHSPTTQLTTKSHFIRLDNTLRLLPLQSVALDANLMEMSLDWRSLCQSFYYDELDIRRVASPWVRYVRRGERLGQVLIHERGWELYRFVYLDRLELFDACKERWIFWDSLPNNPNSIWITRTL